MQKLSTESLHRHVVSVPPLARDANGTIDFPANQAIVDHIAAGGVRTFLYGGNAMFYHLRRREYEQTLEWLSELVEKNFLVIPSVGPAYGLMMDQADVLADHSFSTAMMLPQRDIADRRGIKRAVRDLVDRIGRPIVLYIKFDDYLAVSDVEDLFEDDLISWVKYATVRDDPAQDEYLRELVSRVDPSRIVSGIGEQPAIIHMRDFGVSGYTSGCVCVAPSMSQAMLSACRNRDWDRADQIRRQYEGLEDLRNRIHPISVLHEAVELAGITRTYVIPPLLSPLSDDQRISVKKAATELLALENANSKNAHSNNTGS